MRNPIERIQRIMFLKSSVVLPRSLDSQVDSISESVTDLLETVLNDAAHVRQKIHIPCGQAFDFRRQCRWPDKVNGWLLASKQEIRHFIKCELPSFMLAILF